MGSVSKGKVEVVLLGQRRVRAVVKAAPVLLLLLLVNLLPANRYHTVPVATIANHVFAKTQGQVIK
ncbi:protein of unknown function [Candidatus Nitrotoga arctica]|uniref:Uncharacterized protein n=1 Tax=Candidatus Nitrotoga arctica TaxID=453162 RepID=A0ABM8Z1M6_9PROT|nr:protein of unknown function [Candidatus Nitrotoga arctica]